MKKDDLTLLSLLKVEPPRGFRWHWQNLYDEEHGDTDVVLSGLRHGRAWFRQCRTKLALNVEWQIPTRFCHARLSVGHQSVECGLACGLFAFWATLDGLTWVQPTTYHERELELSFHNATLFWRFWCEAHSWSSRTPKWRDGALNFADLLLGKMKYSHVPYAEETVTIALPEGSYSARIQLLTSTWKRPRWPWTTQMERAEISILDGIPVPGKGENSWDCDEDAVFSLTTSASTISDAVEKLIQHIQETRLHYGGKGWQPEPKQRGDANA